jgi:hypothetical protein
MRWPVWIAVTAAALIAVGALLVLPLGQREVLPTAPSTTPQGPNRTAYVPQTSRPAPPFNASSYEVNYRFVFTVSFSGITTTMKGWVVVGTGPAGNYSFGVLTVPLQGTAEVKVATEGGTTYTMTCLHRQCTVNEEEWPFTGLIVGINVTKVAKGQCKRLGYAGTLYEERGVLDPKAFSRFVEGLIGNYTAYVCEVNGLMLSADLTATASARDGPLRITLKMKAVKAGPYSVDVYNQILQEIKAMSNQ